ncbi:hypothetical protein G8759_31505 [Spirosoma aureum]|uniref:Uncharacterized protein n=1 Tax=Spirosoma aureum TaxID=2692134 RepID=A0A6G9AWX2_9BACT|nr:hypothetical protein [Spirosoma aureum]QIP16848.1 hypothetical protein G8759_31505 [Spirosoma aureum]
MKRSRLIMLFILISGFLQITCFGQPIGRIVFEGKSGGNGGGGNGGGGNGGGGKSETGSQNRTGTNGKDDNRGGGNGGGGNGGGGNGGGGNGNESKSASVARDKEIMEKFLYENFEKNVMIGLTLLGAGIQSGGVMISPYARAGSLALIQTGGAMLTGIQVAEAVYDANQGKWGTAVCATVGIGVMLIPEVGPFLGPVAGSYCNINLLFYRYYADEKLRQQPKKNN